MFAFTLISRIVAAPWQLLRAILRLDGAQETPSARAKARSKSKASSSVAGTNTVPAKPKPKPKMSDAAKPADGSKGELSYHYWHGKGGGNAPVPEPKKLTDEEKAELERQAASNGASAWNAAGTFEERNATSWAKGRLGELVKGLEGLAGGDVSVLDLNSCEGEANIFLVRGKKRCGFDFELQLAWKALPAPGAIEIRGHCKVLNFCSDDPDELEVVPEVGHKQPERAADEAAAVKKVKAALTPALCKVLTQLLEELKAK